MRALILIAGAALALGGCGGNAQKDNAENVDESLTADNIVSNDVTAIDAVTGDAANMAADVDMNFGNLNETAGTAIGNESARPTRAAPRRSPAPVSDTTANSSANMATNAE